MRKKKGGRWGYSEKKDEKKKERYWGGVEILNWLPMEVGSWVGSGCRRDRFPRKFSLRAWG